MRKILLFISILLFPISVFASDYKVINHVIDSEVEIAGALSVKELITIEGTTDSFFRKLNYYSFGESFWDGKSKVDYNGNEFYNGYGLEINEIAVFNTIDELNINELDKGKKESLKEFDITKPSKEGYTKIDNKKGIVDLNIVYPFKEKMSIYIKYTITNVVVKHNDVKEINYTFKNLDLNPKNTIVRFITPYPVQKKEEDLYNVWIHGNQSGQFQELVNSSDMKVGLYGVFTKTNEFNVRMTFPQNHIGIDMYLNNSNEDALENIKEVETKRQEQTNFKSSIIKNAKYGIYVFSGLLVALVILAIIMKFNDIRLYAILEVLALLISVFNYLYYKFDYYYLDLVILIPIIGYVINKLRKTK